MNFLNPVNLVNLAIATNATSPVPATGVGSLAWSTTSNEIVRWDGTFWKRYNVRLLRTAFSAENAVSSGAKTTLLSLSVPANYATSGIVIAGDIWGNYDESVANTLTLSVQINGTDASSLAFSTTGIATAKGWRHQFNVAIPTIGVSGQVLVQSAAFCMGATTTNLISVVNTLATVDTTSTWTIACSMQATGTTNATIRGESGTIIQQI